MHRVVIAGAGFGGIATAAALRRDAAPGELEVVLVDRRDDFVMGLRKTWAALGVATLAEGRRRLSEIDGVEFIQGNIEQLDAAGRSVTVNGRAIAGDSLVLALGAEQDPHAVPGLAERGINVWDRDQADHARSAVNQLAGGQRLLIGIFGLPYSCPPAPFELALMARDRLGQAIDITVFSPAPMALPVVGPLESAKVERMLIDQNIGFLSKHQPVAVHDGRVEFADESSASFDVLLAIPVHRVPHLIVTAGLAEPGGWIKPHPTTLETGLADVYAIGDCTVITLASGLALPKAGIFAELEGEVVAARILARVRDQEPSNSFAGEGFCFVEAGNGRAAKISGAFMADPIAVGISEPTTTALAEKTEFESSRLRSWFGG